MPRKPVIIITAGRQNRAAARGEMQDVFSGCPLEYVDAVLRSGAAPLILPRYFDAAAIDAAVGTADGVLLTGGGDILALAYGEESHPASRYQDPVRDRMELEVLRRAAVRELPILGVCRGLQILNVFWGGTLYQDIPSQVNGALQHYTHGVAPMAGQTVEVEPETLLARLWGTGAAAINSYHHQAIKDLGEGLRVNCRARDGVIEGVEAADGRPVLAVQFHPEELAGEDARHQGLFDWLAQEAVARTAG
ncbi:MAG: gamma-glutamyl-gamma-aminobutyrate hydrolase family protein [Armatimonadetes bacterium]|nr:gamma-glutamyl-gamma-aminobutyrate hydrolase family protein [Armatimonadota bacterium]